MVEKIKINDYGDCVYSEDAVIDLVYQNPELDISKIVLNNDVYNTAVEELGLDLPKLAKQIKRTDKVKDYDKKLYENWHMPQKYYELDVLDWLLERCQTEVEKQRVQQEYKKFQEKNFVKVLQFLIYFVDTLRANDVVWGVGRGSSVSSFCLFLIGVHKINPLIYNLDYREFLR